MKLAGALGACVVGICLLGASSTAGATPRGKAHPRAATDGRLRPGHLETVHVSGFRGKGTVEVSFFPTAICEDECGARSFKAGATDASGSGTLRVHVPGTFFDHRDRPVYFRNGERVEVLVSWEGPGKKFELVVVRPEPIIVRTHGSRHG
jgi:hypothetical protein